MNIRMDSLYSFQIQLTPESEWITSSGRWEDPIDAARKAGEYLTVTAENGHLQCSVRVVTVTELAILEF